MTLDEMCISAARYSDRYDEFEKGEDGKYEDDALQYFEVFRDGINEAYAAVARESGMPDCYVSATVGLDGCVDLENLYPQVYGVKDVLNAQMTSNLNYVFSTKFKLTVSDTKPGDKVTVFYHYIPERLTSLGDAPVFPESIVDPSLYISLAVARMWMSEKKFDYANQWLQQYYLLLNKVKGNMQSRANRKIPRRRFR